MEPLIEGSTRPVTSVVTHADVRTAHQYELTEPENTSPGPAKADRAVKYACSHLQGGVGRLQHALSIRMSVHGCKTSSGAVTSAFVHVLTAQPSPELITQ